MPIRISTATATSTRATRTSRDCCRCGGASPPTPSGSSWPRGRRGCGGCVGGGGAGARRLRLVQAGGGEVGRARAVRRRCVAVLPVRRRLVGDEGRTVLTSLPDEAALLAELRALAERGRHREVLDRLPRRPAGGARAP